MRVLYEDPALLAVDKAPGELVVRGRLGAREKSLWDQLRDERGEELLPTHRLDRGTSGVLVFARNRTAHRALSKAFEQGRYLALVRGEPPWEELEVEVALVPARRGKSRPAAAGENGKPTRTAFRVLEHLGGYALLEATPKTGRTHQIRVHLKSVGFPLAVDPHYGSAKVLRRGELGLEAPEVVLDRTPLHALEIQMPHPLSGEAIRIEAPLASDMEAALKSLRLRRPG
jgi:RluA family pseudouridine synthase